MINQLNQPEPIPAFLKTIANEVRWKLLHSLAVSDYRVQELVSLTQQPQNLVSYHLKQLRAQQLVSERRSSADARDIYYSLNIDTLQREYAEVGTALHPSLRFSQVAGNNHSYLPKRILVLCTENSARSQMAEGFIRHLTTGQVDVISAGTQPTSIHPLAVQTMAAHGIDISQQQAKQIDTVIDPTLDRPFDYVISVCDRARENCPMLSTAAQYIHWSLPDPAAVKGSEEEQYQAFSNTADELLRRIKRFLVSLPHSDK